MTSESLAAGTYEVLRNRLREAAADLQTRFVQLNAARAAVFGNIETRLLATAHVSTDHNCVPRDLVAVGSILLLGSNVHFGLKTEVTPADVFNAYRWDDQTTAHHLPLDLLGDPRFQRDFAELYRYYKNASFARFFQQGPLLYMVFQVGKTAQDIKAFKWIQNGESLEYIDNRSDHEVRYPAQHAFRWVRTTRDQHRTGKHPHVSIHDLVFVECVGGDLTIKIEDNTDDGFGIYREAVEHSDQTLDDAEIHYALLGSLVLLKIRPYQEKEFRYLVYSVKQRAISRLDGIRDAAVLLPDDQGIIFPGGYCLQSGVLRQFDHGLTHLHYERTVAAPNGEDFLYLFFHAEDGIYLHLRYNLIRQDVDTPHICHGQAFFGDGRMVSFRAPETPQKHHALQIWQTAWLAADQPVQVETDSLLYKIGNRELVRGMAECQEILQLVAKDESYADLYLDLIKQSTDILDGYFWIDQAETMQLAEPLRRIRSAAEAAVAEYQKVVRLRQDAKSALEQVSQATEALLKAGERSRFDSVDEIITQLDGLRAQRGHALGLRERPYMDQPAVDSLQDRIAAALDLMGQRCVAFLLQPNAFQPFHQRLHEVTQRVEQVEGAAAGRELEAVVANIARQLELLVDTVSQLKIDDVTQRTSIVDATGDVLAEVNRVRANLKARMRDLLSGEMEADFASQIKLLDQAVAGALETADSPEQVDESLTRTAMQLEELEGRFVEFDGLLQRLAEKRAGVYGAFESRREQLVEVRTRRAAGLTAAAERILPSIITRAARLSDPDAQRAYFAADPLVDKVRQIAAQLAELGDTVRQDDLLSRLKAMGDDAQRQLRDRLDLYSSGDQAIRLGAHQFAVHRQPIELTTVVRNGSLQLHVTGTQFFQTLHDPSLEAARDLWEQTLVSESTSVYRGEYLAFRLLEEAEASTTFRTSDVDERTKWVRERMQGRHQEGYARGVHDHDGALILGTLVDLRDQLGLLRFPPRIRARAWFCWRQLVPRNERVAAETWMQGFALVEGLLPEAEPDPAYVARTQQLLESHGGDLLGPQEWREAADYLFAQIRLHRKQLVLNLSAIHTTQRLTDQLAEVDRQRLQETLAGMNEDPRAAWLLARDAVRAFLKRHPAAPSELALTHEDEVALLLLMPDFASSPRAASPPAHRTVTGLLGDHPRIRSGEMIVHAHELVERVGAFEREVVPRYASLAHTKLKLLDQARRQLRTHEFRPQVLTSFVRNQLIDEVYLPRIGDNLAKQIGAAGDLKRTDRMGLLLLISPPGYGKTTLMEYIANRLGLVFVKINGPALGHEVTSLDPASAPNIAAQAEVERINLALEMGDNVMLYLDDIQHCHPELLQKFIPLCDGTRRMEGVWQGVPRSYDLRGRKFAVVMAGNPYTESGARFQVPDMLANRADVYNLGEIVGDAREPFERSYLENCLASNPYLQPLTRAPRADQLAVIRAAEQRQEDPIELEGSLPSDQLADMLSVLTKLCHVRDVVLSINRQYIASAAQADAYRTEPPFKLQGSYRNMNRIAERVVPVLEERELQTLIVDQYQQDAQTLSRDTEANLLKFKELMNLLTPEESTRWEQIKYAFVEKNRLSGLETDDRAAQVLVALSALRDGLESIRRTVAEAAAAGNGSTTSLAEALTTQLTSQLTSLQATVRPDTSLTDSLEPRVIVQHSVPRVITDLIRSQFQLLYDGLRPVLEASTRGTASSDRLRESLETVLADYRRLQEEAETQTDEHPDEKTR